MKKVTIMCGVSGSGKSYEAMKLQLSAPGESRVVSADHYFTDRSGSYAFSVALLGEAHAACLRRFLDEVQGGTAHVIVDNTNTTIAEIAPYVAIAQAYGYEVEIRTMHARSIDLESCAQRNTHGVSLEAISGQHQRLTSRRWPFHWEHGAVTFSVMSFK